MGKLKQQIIETLDKVGKTDVAYIIKELKAKAMIMWLDRSITKGEMDFIIETCEEYVANNAKA